MPRDLFQDLFGYLGNAAGKVAGTLLEEFTCVDCGETAVPIKCVCGNYACHEHGFFNLNGACICPVCAQRLAEEGGYLDENGRPARRRGRGQARPRAQQATPRIKPPWEVLGLTRSATAADVNRAFRQMALDCHPDLHPGDPTARKRFQALQ
jgi:hypothetical protein